MVPAPLSSFARPDSRGRLSPQGLYSRHQILDAIENKSVIGGNPAGSGGVYVSKALVSAG
jgi:hypothetical protein